MTEQPTAEPTPSQLLPFREMLEDDAISALVRPTLGELSFDGVQAPLRSVQHLLDEAIPQESEIPVQRVAQAVAQLDGLRSLIQRIPEFSVTEANPAGTRDEIVAGIKSYRDALIEALRPAMRGDSADLAIRLGQTERALAETRDMNARLEALIGQTRQGQVEEAGEKASDFFEKQATAHNKTATKFLWGTVGLSVALVLVVIAEFVDMRKNPPRLQRGSRSRARREPPQTDPAPDHLVRSWLFSPQLPRQQAPVRPQQDEVDHHPGSRPVRSRSRAARAS